MTILETPDIIRISEYIEGKDYRPLFLAGDAQNILPLIPAHSIDCCMTSPPYWNKREYANGGLGLESSPEDFIRNLLGIFAQIHRVLKDTGSVWLNIGDSYANKAMIGVPWRLAIKLMDEQGWILRNDVIWNKIKGPDNTNDKLRNTHEHVFHFVKNAKGYYYDAAAIRSKPRLAQIKNGAVISATGVTGIRYKPLDTTGTVWPQRQRFLQEVGVVPKTSTTPNKPYGMTWKMTAKTILVQLHHKTETFEQLNRHLVLVIQEPLLAYMRLAFSFDHVQAAKLGDSMHFHAYSLQRIDNQPRLSLSSRFSTDAKGVAASLGLQISPSVEMEVILATLQAKISERTLLAIS